MNNLAGTPHLAITGATGYIGRELIRMALAKQWRVTALARHRPEWLARLPVRYVHYDLAIPLSREVLIGVTAVIHLAADTRDESLIGGIPEQPEIDATLSLMEAAAQPKARFVFASSQSAQPDAPSRYGRVKWRIEQEVVERGGTAVRIGLVYGGTQEDGLFGRLCKLARGLPVLPALVPPPRVQPIYVSDLCQAFLTLTKADRPPDGVYNLAQPESVSFNRFVKILARERVRKSRVFLPVPLLLLSGLSKLAQRIPRIPDPGLHRLTSLAALQPMNTSGSLSSLGVTLTAIEDGMHPSGSARRRGFAREGRALLSYVLDCQVGPGLVRRYMRVVEVINDSRPLDLPRIVLTFPCLLRFAEGFAGNERDCNHGLRERLRLAVAIAEASPVGAQRFMALDSTSRIAAVMKLGLTIVGDIGFYLARLGSVLWRSMAKVLK